MRSAIHVLAAVAALATAVSAHATTVRIHYDAKDGDIRVVGTKGPMTWDAAAPARKEADGVWTYTWPDKLGDVEMKPKLGKDNLSVGSAYKLPAGAVLDIYPFFGAPFGKVTLVPDFASPQLNNKRNLRIYLPPSYDENRAKRYPVLYMHDGQNLFDAKTAAYGAEWGIDETANALIAGGKMDEVIVVGIDNTPDRIPEYTPCCDPKYGGGKIDAYMDFIVDTVKPWVDAHYRTLKGKDDTAIMGSSLGGIASVYIAEKHPEVFSKAGGVSSSFWWNQQALVKNAKGSARRVPVKFYLDAGTSNDGVEDTRLMHEAMRGQGYRDGVDLLYIEAEGGSHNEKSWAARVDRPLQWFFPWGSTRY
ncbi:alpha/beta hydrolase [Massilia arenosa]|uniref:Alpha/beta hydrolase n=1 Tax=Zemynaea arenosa TaxID=2561931 RepID=A0A4Y9SRR6_9BURK|nr:alpha/beta hydrolase-fold protein [Massilia arenosa]TFW29390.1 alpha/beta hydrolase [Massilia arenosa]